VLIGAYCSRLALLAEPELYAKDGRGAPVQTRRSRLRQMLRRAKERGGYDVVARAVAGLALSRRTARVTATAAYGECFGVPRSAVATAVAAQSWM